MADRPFVRVYHADLIRDYPDVWDDDAALAAWLRLLVAADGSWPAPAELPRSVKPRSLSALTDSGLLSLSGSHRFHIKGMDAERSQRQDAARNAAAKRWHSGSHAVGNAGRNAETMPSRAEPSRAIPSRAEPDAPASLHDPFEEPEQEALAWLAKHGCDIRPGNGYHQKLVVAVEHHGVNALIGMMDRLAAAGTKTGDTKGFLFGAIDALDKRSRPNLAALEAEERADEGAAARQRRIEKTRSETAALREVMEAKDLT
jgi:hypothetical protein